VGGRDITYENGNENGERIIWLRRSCLQVASGTEERIRDS
jgi:hypothetical protein